VREGPRQQKGPRSGGLAGVLSHLGRRTRRWSLTSGLPGRGGVAGRVDTARRWVGCFDEQGLIDRYPQVAVQESLLHALVGQPTGANRWADAAERASAMGMLQEHSTVDAPLALLRAFLCGDGVERMRADAEAAVAGLVPASPWRAVALATLGWPMCWPARQTALTLSWPTRSRLPRTPGRCPLGRPGGLRRRGPGTS
jgi:hypothetical protein